MPSGSLSDERIHVQLEELAKRFAKISTESVPSKILHWSTFAPYRLGIYNGDTDSEPIDQLTWQQFYLELEAGTVPGGRTGQVVPLAEVGQRAAAHRRAGAIPISIAHFVYHTPRKRFVAEVVQQLERRKEIKLPDPGKLKDVLEERSAFFATALLRDHYVDFSLQPYAYSGLEIRFIVPSDCYFSNTGKSFSKIEVDFDDGAGYREVVLDESLDITYEKPSIKQLRLRARCGEQLYHSDFELRVRALSGPHPDEHWDLQASIAWNGEKATGCADVFFGYARDGEKHTVIENPVVIADGFGAQSCSPDAGETSAPSAFDVLLNAGKDIIFLKYSDGTDFVQANGFLAIACIEEAQRRQHSKTPLAIGGISMGGLVARFALLYMESHGMDHRTQTYFSVDTPHLGANIPTGAQAAILNVPNILSEKLRRLQQSPAAQQMLYVWAPTADPPPETDNRHRRELYDWFADHGLFPARTKNLGISDGTGDGKERSGTPPGEMSIELGIEFDTSQDLCRLELFNLPRPGESDFVTASFRHLNIFDPPTVQDYTVGVLPAYDSAPGGEIPFFQIDPPIKGCTIAILSSGFCFIPTVSALAIKGADGEPPDLYTEIRPGETPSYFDDYLFSSKNRIHASMTPEMMQWLLERMDGEKSRSGFLPSLLRLVSDFFGKLRRSLF